MNFKTSANRIFSNKYVSVAITLLILIACSLPGNELPSAMNSYDKPSHFLAFAVWGFCWLGAPMGPPCTDPSIIFLLLE